ncbi:LPS export ABC transporter periplasmic protein LptC [Thalassococcus lentus]|uniref:LPS export ABC transporter periplasmic protein LptC n=1 Tax=Thalassococcus lentus TaxID=1210524 RepID=A0ABT4XPP5_9RHOB|nr:LPS export ABC transporter periplasmic protein LptC [Thalassococcus lentus]MDA7423872.1 LPS export ABC transporter periplasmic protein LptC [Thalassococcus lentus]
MARAEGLYSRVVAWLKIILPLAALALLSTLFLLSRSGDPMMDTPFAEALASGETVQQKVSAPYFAGTTRRGEMLIMTAESARPGLDGKIHANSLEATLTQSNGATIQLNAPEATLRDGQQEALLEGGVRIESSTGYVVVTDGLISEFNETRARTTGPVKGTAPFGTLDAGGLQISPAETEGDVLLLFTDGVKLIYEPKPKE